MFASLQLTWQGLRGSGAQYLVVHSLTVRPAALLINTLTPAAHAQAVGFDLRAPGGGLNILNGCEGVEALFLLVAALAVARARWRARLIGLVAGAGVVFIVNEARILALFYAFRADHGLFYWLHATVTPIAVVLLVASYFYAWLSYATDPLAEPR